jgi:hypothetical protein
VSTFQVMAPTSAPNTTWVSTTPGCTMPLPTVAATLRWKDEDGDEVEEGRKQHGLRAGLSTPVDTTVAMEFAAS